MATTGGDPQPADEKAKQILEQDDQQKKIPNGASDGADPTAELFGFVEKLGVYIVCIVVLAAAGYVLERNITRANETYSGIVQSIENDASKLEGRDRLTSTVAIVGMRDTLELRSTVIFVGFIGILMGCILVLKGVEAMYNLRLREGEKEAALSTASPGLVLITAGVLLVVFGLRQDSKVSLDLESGAAVPTAPQAQSGQDVQNRGEVGKP